MNEKEILDKIEGVFITNAVDYINHKGDPEIHDIICEFGSALAGLNQPLYNLEELITLVTKQRGEE